MHAYRLRLHQLDIISNNFGPFAVVKEYSFLMLSFATTLFITTPKNGLFYWFASILCTYTYSFTYVYFSICNLKES
jgi:hypothetical protein